MKRLVVALLLAVGLASTTAWAVTYTGSETIAVTGTPVGLTVSKIAQGGGHAQALSAQCRNEGAQIRFTIDPTVTVSATANGAILNDGDWVPVGLLNDAVMLANFRAIITTITASKLQCFYIG